MIEAFLDIVQYYRQLKAPTEAAPNGFTAAVVENRVVGSGRFNRANGANVYISIQYDGVVVAWVFATSRQGLVPSD